MQGLEYITLTDSENNQLWDAFNAYSEKEQIKFGTETEKYPWFNNVQKYFINKKQIFCETMKDLNADWEAVHKGEELSFFAKELVTLEKLIQGLRPAAMVAADLTAQKENLDLRKTEISEKIAEQRQVKQQLANESQQLARKHQEQQTRVVSSNESEQLIAEIESNSVKSNTCDEKITQYNKTARLVEDYQLFLTALQLYLAEKDGTEKPEGYADYEFSQIQFLVKKTSVDKGMATKAESSTDEKPKQMQFSSDQQEAIWTKLNLLQKHLTPLSKLKSEMAFISELAVDGLTHSKYLLQVQYKKLTGTSNSNFADNMRKTLAEAGEIERAANLRVFVEDPAIKDAQIAEVIRQMQEIGVDPTDQFAMDESELLEAAKTIDKKWDVKSKTARFNEILNSYTEKNILTNSLQPFNSGAGLLSQYQSHKTECLAFKAMLYGKIITRETAETLGLSAAYSYLQELNATVPKDLQAIDALQTENDSMENILRAQLQQAMAEKQKIVVSEPITQPEKMQALLQKIQAFVQKTSGDMEEVVDEVSKKTELVTLSTKILGKEDWRADIAIGINHPSVEVLEILTQHIANLTTLMQTPLPQTSLRINTLSRFNEYLKWIANASEALSKYKEYAQLKNDATYIVIQKDLNKISTRLSSIVQELMPIKTNDSTGDRRAQEAISEINPLLVSFLQTLSQFYNGQKINADELQQKEAAQIYARQEIIQTIALLLVAVGNDWVKNNEYSPYYALLQLRTSLKNLDEHIEKNSEMKQLRPLVKGLKHEIDDAMKKVKKENKWKDGFATELTDRYKVEMFSQDPSRHRSFLDKSRSLVGSVREVGANFARSRSNSTASMRPQGSMRNPESSNKFSRFAVADINWSNISAPLPPSDTVSLQSSASEHSSASSTSGNGVASATTSASAPKTGYPPLVAQRSNSPTPSDSS